MAIYKKSFLQLLMSFVLVLIVQDSFAQFAPYDISSLNGKYAFSYSQTPDNLVPVNPTATGTSYSWEKSLTPLFDAPVAVGSSATYSFSGPLAQTTYYRRKITITGIGTVISNIVKIEVVSQNWEDINYVREHDMLVSGETDWKAIDQLPIGQKLQTTTYLDGLGRPVEKVSRETATPSQGSQWGMWYSSINTIATEGNPNNIFLIPPLRKQVNSNRILLPMKPNTTAMPLPIMKLLPITILPLTTARLTG